MMTGYPSYPAYPAGAPGTQLQLTEPDPVQVAAAEPARQRRATVAFRLIVVGGWAVVFIIALYTLAGAFRTSTPLAIISGIASVAAAYGIIYNLDHMRDAGWPPESVEPRSPTTVS